MDDFVIPEFIAAHTPAIGSSKWQSLYCHSQGVAEMAARFAGEFGAAEIAFALGLVHDAGKTRPEFQRYLHACAKEPGKRFTSVAHKDVGAALYGNSPLGQALFGHHGGLPDRGEFDSTIQKLSAKGRDSFYEAIDMFQKLGLPIPLPLPQIPHDIESAPLATDLFTRMLFSCLVDADGLDTEAHWEPTRSALRSQPSASIADYLARFEEDQLKLEARVREAGNASTKVNLVRQKVYQRCVEAASLPPGIFRLTVPTGGGKTRSGTAFALHHAVQHGMRRIIYAVPFLTITEQTTAVLRSAFGSDLPVVEHHSNAYFSGRDEGTWDPFEQWSRLTAENWSAPIIVTTTVQLYESLFANMPSRCRKLHNIAKSVIVIDEFQTLPEKYREPIFDALYELVQRYRVTVVLSTATQPVMDTMAPEIEHRNVIPVELAPNPPELFSWLERVEYEWPVRESTWSWDRVVDEMRSVDQCLCIVNTIDDAATLYRLLDDPDALHLSTRMYARHRQRVLNEIRGCLERGVPCRVISTQLVEAGVDIDFPVVFRAFAPLGSIIQAAGRCNREGRLQRGRVVVFDPEEGGSPPGAYSVATQETMAMLREGIIDPGDPEKIELFFARYYRHLDPDVFNVQHLRAQRMFASVAKAVRVIDDNSAAVIVANRAESIDGTEAETVINNVKDAVKYGGLREALREAQPFMVNVRAYKLDEYRAHGLVAELCPGVFEWLGSYDTNLGITIDRTDTSRLIV